MNKTNPIGVRFNQELLNKLKEKGVVATHQGALNLYEKSYLELVELRKNEKDLELVVTNRNLA